MYADDSIIYLSRKSAEIINQVLNQDLRLVAAWCFKNSMVLNYNKSKCMLISTAQNLKHQSKKTLANYINSHLLKNVNNQKLLGVIVDNRLLWSSHINYITKRIRSRLKVLYRIRDFRPIFARLVYFNSFISSQMDYCSTVWSGASTYEINRLFAMQKKCARMILDKQYNEGPTILDRKVELKVVLNSIRCIQVLKKKKQDLLTPIT